LQANAVNTTGATLVEWIIFDSTEVPNEIHITVKLQLIFLTNPVVCCTINCSYCNGCTDTAYHQFAVFGTPVTIFDPALTNVCGNDTTITFGCDNDFRWRQQYYL
jgi:hypothetical protein